MLVAGSAPLTTLSPGSEEREVAPVLEAGLEADFASSSCSPREYWIKGKGKGRVKEAARQPFLPPLLTPQSQEMPAVSRRQRRQRTPIEPRSPAMALMGRGQQATLSDLRSTQRDSLPASNSRTTRSRASRAARAEA
jgi:hypothetical protein